MEGRMIKIRDKVRIATDGSERKGMIGEVVDVKRTGRISQFRIQFPDFSIWAFSEQEVEKIGKRVQKKGE